MKIKTISKLMIAILMVAIVLPIIKVEAVMKNNNPLLREILIEGQAIQPEFDQFITDYVLAVDSNKEKIEIEAVTDDPNAKAEIIGNRNLKVGVNNFEIKVTAEDEKTTNSYFLHITRGDINKANANLKNIEIEGITLNPIFNSKDTSYLAEYNGYIENLKITAIPENEKAKVEILDNNNFNSTIHIVTIKVIAEDGITTKEYKITAKKAGEDVENPSGLEEHEKEMENSHNSKKKEENYSIFIIAGIAIIVAIGIVIITVKNGKKK